MMMIIAGCLSNVVLEDSLESQRTLQDGTIYGLDCFLRRCNFLNYSRKYRVAQLKWGQLTFFAGNIILVTFEYIGKIQ